MIHHWWFIPAAYAASQLLVGALFTYPVGLAYWRRVEPLSSATPAADARFSALWAMGVPWPVGAVALIVELRYRGVWPGFMWLPTPPDWGRADRALMALGLFAAATGAGLTAVWLRPEPWACPWWVRLPLAAGLLVSGVAVLTAELRKVRP